jgi:sterol desaturase/sphingolipid hydroxylase (fatty acid hydroxylase superfamily)
MSAWAETLLVVEGPFRLIAFLGVLTLVAGAESVFPRRRRRLTRAQRWPGNLLLVALSAVLARLLLTPFALLPVAGAALAQAQGWGLFNGWSHGLPANAVVMVSILLLDLAIYGQHVAFHRWPPLWRLHRMHHADQDYDTTTGLRFHPLEILISIAYKLALVFALGVPPVAVLIFEVVLNGSALFNHGNLRLPLALDRLVRLLLVTPDMHRVHHSVLRHETDSNFGFCFPWWDRLFQTYIAQPEQGHQAMTIGLSDFRTAHDQTLWAMLRQPWR